MASNTNHASPWKAFQSSAKANPVQPRGVKQYLENETKSKMKKLRNHLQLNQQENSPKAINKEINLCSLTNLYFKREIVKILKE